MKKYKWNAKKFIVNILKLILILFVAVAIYNGVKSKPQSPLAAYYEHLRNGGTWQTWREANAENR